MSILLPIDLIKELDSDSKRNIENQLRREREGDEFRERIRRDPWIHRRSDEFSAKVAKVHRDVLLLRADICEVRSLATEAMDEYLDRRVCEVTGCRYFYEYPDDGSW